MSLLFLDGCLGGDFATKWDSTSTGVADTSSPRFPGGGYVTSATLYKTLTATSELYPSGAWNIPSGSATLMSFYGDAGATQHVTITRNSSGHLEARRGSSSGTVLATGTATLTNGTWNSVEARVTISDTVGVVQVRVNGSTSADISFSGDTKNGGTATTIDKVAYVAGTGISLTDVRIQDTAGSVNNSWAGDGRVLVISPSGPGTYADGDDQDGNTDPHWDSINGQPFTAFPSLALVGGGQESFAMAAGIPLGTTTVAGVQVNLYIAQDPDGPQDTDPLIRIGGTDYLGAGLTPALGMSTRSQVWQANPATSAAWVPSDLASFEAGVQVETGTGLTYLAGYSIEAAFPSVPTLNIVSVVAHGSVLIDIPNEVEPTAIGSITVHAAGELGGNVVVLGTGSISVHDAVTDFPRDLPADPTLDEPYPGEAPVRRISLVYPDPTLVNGIPVNWEAT